jgi:hypothetical protein
VGDGSKISFWRDRWCGEITLKVAFPVLYGLACEKDTSIVDNLFMAQGEPYEVKISCTVL